MKKYFILFILLIMFLITGCSKTKFNITNTVEYNYIVQNKEHITDFIVKSSGFTLEGEKCYKLDKDTLIDTLNKIKTIKKTKENIADSDLYYIIKFDDDTTKTFKFESYILIYNDERYKVEMPILLLSSNNEIPCD